MTEDLESQVMVTLTLRFPALDRRALAEHLTAVITEAIAAGGHFTSVYIGGYEPEDEEAA